jgi:uncharacterized protein YjbI with pentapeptide repeats
MDVRAKESGAYVEQGQIRRERALYLLRLLIFGWRPTVAQVVWTVRIVIVLGVLILVGYELGFKFGEWYPLFVIPVLLAAAGYWFDRSQSNRQQRAEEQRAQNTALQEYLNAMKDLFLDQEPRARGQQEISVGQRKLARARTFTVLARLDDIRQGNVVRFLSEAGLINRGDPNRSDPNQGDPVIPLGGTRRKQPRLVGIEMRDGDAPMAAGGLGEYALTLGGANLEKIDLQGADFSGTDLSHVVLNFANFIGADLTGAALSGSLLVGADLTGADLDGAILNNATFQWANLYQANITDVELQRLASRGALIGAIMPDGSRPFSVPPQAEAEISKHPESELAQRERELGSLSRLLQQQASPR